MTLNPQDDDGLPPVPGDPLYYKLPPLPQDEPEPPTQQFQAPPQPSGPQYGAPYTGYAPPNPQPYPQPQAFDRNGQAHANAYAGMTPEQAWAQYHHQQQYGQVPTWAPQPPPAVAVSQAVTVNNRMRGGSCPHMLHLVLTVLTCGMWLPIWIIHAIVDSFR